MDYDEPDFDAISPESLRITENRWKAVWGMLIDSGFVEGKSWRVTLKGLEYLNRNSFMLEQKAKAQGY